MQKIMKVLLSGLFFTLFFPLTVFASNIDLSQFQVKAIGEEIGDRAGYSVSSAGDINNDGYDDILIGVVSNAAGGNDAGAVYIIYGSTSLASSIDLSSANVKFIGEETHDLAGFFVSSAGDVNNDHYDDILISAINNDAGGNNAGAVYLIYGSSSLTGNIDLSSANAKFIGEEAGDEAGYSVSSAGDINHDGYDDIMIGSDGNNTGGSVAGAAYLIYGSSSLTGNIDLSSANAKFIGEEAEDSAGFSVSSAGDINHDGYSDILIGAYGNDTGGSGAGAAYLIYGSSSLTGHIDLSLANAKFIGEEAGDVAGEYVSLTEDINKDGNSDILINAKSNDIGGSSAGAAYLIYGSSSLTGNIDLSLANAKFIGEEANDEAGASFSTGDVNNDGFIDILIGSSYNDAGGNNAGAAYLGYYYIDADHDGVAGTAGFFSGTDCNDHDATVSTNQTYYQDFDADGKGNINVTTAVCSSVPPSGYVANSTDLNDTDHDNDGISTNLDCNDSDNTISANQTYYQDLDGDGLGNLNVTNIVCSYTVPTGYVTNSTDANDSIKDISSIAPATNGDILITYVNNDQAIIDVFNVTSTKETIILQYNSSSEYYLALHPQGKQLALVNINTKEILTKITLSKKISYSKNYLKILTFRNKKLAVVVSKKKAKILTSLVYPNIAKEKLTKKDSEKLTNKNIKPSKTKKHKNYLQLRNSKNKVLAQYFVTSKYKLILK